MLAKECLKPGDIVKAFHPMKFGVANHGTVVQVRNHSAVVDFGELGGGKFDVGLQYITEIVRDETPACMKEINTNFLTYFDGKGLHQLDYVVTQGADEGPEHVRARTLATFHPTLGLVDWEFGEWVKLTEDEWESVAPEVRTAAEELWHG